VRGLTRGGGVGVRISKGEEGEVRWKGEKGGMGTPAWWRDAKESRSPFSVRESDRA